MSRTGSTIYRKRRKEALAETDVCQLCGKWLDPDLPIMHPDSASTDHKIPVSLGGDNDHGELIVVCLDCNRKRQTMPYADFREKYLGGTSHGRTW